MGKHIERLVCPIDPDLHLASRYQQLQVFHPLQPYDCLSLLVLVVKASMARDAQTHQFWIRIPRVIVDMRCMQVHEIGHTSPG